MILSSALRRVFVLPEPADYVFFIWKFMPFDASTYDAGTELEPSVTQCETGINEGKITEEDKQDHQSHQQD